VIDIGNLRRAASMLDNDLRWRWVGLGVLSVFAAMLEAVGALGIFWLIGIVSNPAMAAKLPIVGPLAVKLGFDGGTGWLIWCSVGVMVFYALKNTFLVFFYYLQIRLPYDAYVRVSTALLRGYMTTGYSFHFDRNSAEVIRNLINSVDIVFRTVFHNAVTLVSEVLMAVAVLGVLLAASPREALLASGALIALAWIMFRLTQRRVTKWGKQIQSLAKDVLKVINQGLGALKEVKVLHRENYFLAQYNKLLARQSKVMCYYETFQNIPVSSLEALFAFLLGGLTILVTVQGGDRAAAIPMLGLYGYAGIRLLPALARISAKLQRMSFGSAAVDQVYADYSKLSKAPATTAADVMPLPFVHEIRYEDVTYIYPKGNRPALDRVSLAVPYGSSVGVVGPSGAGKSTLIDVLMGLLLPGSGRVLVDGVDTAASVAAWQRNLGYVPQAPYLLDDTLRRNIAFGIADADIDEMAVADAVRSAQLSDLVASQPKGLDTEIGERGIRLSGGQRQRIVIARALYRRPSVIVFDEATSALDAQTEREIASAIESLAGQKTIIIIAHRMTTVRKCDFIVFLVAGQVDDVGSYDELLARNLAFNRLALADASMPADHVEGVDTPTALSNGQRLESVK
jgi:ATP-binding cassette subfamily C protein